MSDWAKTLPELLHLAWSELERGAESGDAAARLVVLATVDRRGHPRARTLALRAVDRAGASLKIHTDAATPKVSDLRANPQAEIHIWIEHLQLQIRLHGRAKILTGAEVARDWSRVPPASRGNYGVTPAPGTPIPEATAYDRAPDLAKFAVIHIGVDEIDVVHLGTPTHRRARYARADGWAGQWLAP